MELILSIILALAIWTIFREQILAVICTVLVAIAGLLTMLIPIILVIVPVSFMISLFFI